MKKEQEQICSTSPIEEGWEDKIRKDYAGIVLPEQIEATVNYWRDFIRSAISRARKEERAPYDELLYAVARKFEGETRHETALRYIRESEQRASSGPTALTDKLKEK